MSKDSPSPPPAPDPTATANAQSGSNIATAIANAQLNRVNQTTPWGSISYTQGAPGPNGVPTWSSQIQLSPQQQALLDQQQGMQLQRNQIAQGYLGQVGQPLDLSNLHPIDMRGQMYTGAVNAAPAAGAQPVAPAQQAQPAVNSQQTSALISQILAMLGGSGVTSPTGAASPSSGGLGGPTPGAAPPANTPAPAPPSTPAPSTNPALDLSKPTWGSSNGMVYQYGHDSQGRDTFGPGTDEAGNPLGNQDGSMIGSRDLRYGAAEQALAQNPGYMQVRVAQQGVPGGFKDPRLVKYDPTVGYITPESNIVASPDDTTARMLMVLAPALAGVAAGAYAGAGIGGGEAATGGAAGAAGSAETGSMVGNAAMPGYAGAFDAEGASGLAGSAYDPFAAGAAGAAGAGAPVTDLSVQASQPGFFQQAGDNLMNGRGLLGMSNGQRAAVGLLPSLLRAMSSRNGQGGGK